MENKMRKIKLHGIIYIWNLKKKKFKLIERAEKWLPGAGG